MSELDRLKKLSGILNEDYQNDGEITKDSVKNSALELLVDIAKTSKQYKGEVSKDQVHYLGSLVHDFDMAGIDEEKYSEIEKLFRTMADTEKADMAMIQPAYAQAKNLDEECKYCGGNCPNDEEYACDGYLGDIDNLYGTKTDESVQEAVGDSAECFYDLQDEYCGEQCPSMPHKILIDELVRYLSGDQLQDFCDDFRRHHMDGMEESKDLNELRKLAGMGTGTDLPGPDGRFPGGDPEIINKKGLGPIKPEKKPFPGFEPGMAINLDAFKDRDKIVKDDPRIHRGIDYDEIERRMDRIKNEPIDLDKYKFKWQGNQD